MNEKKGPRVYKTNFFSTHILFQIISFFLIFGFGITILFGIIFDLWSNNILFIIAVGNIIGSTILFLNILYILLKYHPFSFYMNGIEFPPLHKNSSGEHRDFLKFTDIESIKVVRTKIVLDRKILLQTKNGISYSIPLYHVPEEKVMSILMDIFGEQWDMMYEELDKS